MRTFVLAFSIVALAALGSTGCATKGYVKNRVGEVNDKVESVSKSLEETQERTRKNEVAITEANQRITQVDQKAAAAGESANAAKGVATTATAKVEAVEKASKRIIYEVTLSEDQGNFAFGKSTLPEEATKRIDEVVQQLKGNPNGAYIEIAGYTDNRGDREFNQKLGLERAEAVKRYIYQTHQIPLHRMSVISFGMDNPIAPNTTKEGRAKNRRVVIRVLV